MFKAPFSFSGRMRRSEFWLCYIIQNVLTLVCAFLNDVHWLLGLASAVPLIWFVLASGTKRCHDRGNPGYFMIIPLYGLWMLFADSEPGANQYGPNPKNAR